MRCPVLPLLCIAPALVAQQAAAPAETPLSAAERRQAAKLLRDARAAVEAAAKLSPAQRAWKPAADRWSVDECLEHIAIVESKVAGLATAGLGAPRNPAARGEIKFTDQEIVEMLKDRSHKAQAPESVVPHKQFADLAAMESAFNKAHGTLEELVKSSAADLRARTAPHPFFGPLDLYQWVLLTAGHTLRHCAQIDEVKATAGFPKSGS
jgi:hypothetical protein